MSFMFSSRAGMIREESSDTGYKRFKTVYNASGYHMTAGGVVAKVIPGSTYYNDEVTGVQTANLNLLAGVVHETIASASFGEIQTYGYRAQAYLEGTTDITAGTSLKGADGQIYMVTDQDVGTAPTYDSYAISYGAWATAAAALKPVFCFFKE